MAEIFTLFGVAFLVWMASTVAIILFCEYSPHFDEREDLEE
jgi:hypothetical protein